MPGTREPARQVQHDAGKEARLGRTGEQAQGVKPGRGTHEQQAGGEQAPADHHDRHPAAGADALQDQIARHPAGQVTDEENARAQPVHGLAHAQVAQHLLLGKAHVDPVQVIEQVADEQERDQPPQDLAVGRTHVIGGREGPGGLGHRTLQQSEGHPVRSAAAPTPGRWSTHSRLSVFPESSSGCCLSADWQAQIFVQMPKSNCNRSRLVPGSERNSYHAVGAGLAAPMQRRRPVTHRLADT